MYVFVWLLALQYAYCKSSLGNLFMDRWLYCKIVVLLDVSCTVRLGVLFLFTFAFLIALESGSLLHTVIISKHNPHPFDY